MTRISDIAFLLNEQAEAYATYLLGTRPTLRRGNEIRFGENGSIKINTGGTRRGKWTNFVDGTHGDMLDLCMTTVGCSRTDALEHGRAWLGLPTDGPAPELPPRPTPQDTQDADAQDRARKQRTANGIWKRAGGSSAGTDLYLQGRGITQTRADWLRERQLGTDDLQAMHIDPASSGGRPVTALVFGATNADNQLTAVQQVLTVDGKKLSIDRPKKTNGDLKGSVVKLDPAGRVLAWAEGPETGMSFRQSTGIPTWVTLGTSNAPNIPLPEVTKTLLLLVDLEPSGMGLAAALRAAAVFDRDGVEVRLVLPGNPLSMSKDDINDVLQASGDAGVQALLPGFSTRHPGATRTIITTDARNGLAAWCAVGGKVRLARIQQEFRIHPDVHFPDDATEILLLCPPNEVPDCTAWCHRHPQVPVRVVETPNHALMQAFQDEGVEVVAARIQCARTAQSLPFYQHQALEDSTSRILLCQSRAAADALPPTPGWKAMAWNTGQPITAWDWSLLARRNVVLAPVHTQAGLRMAAWAAQALRDQGAQVDMLLWPKGRKPSATGWEARNTPLPDGYDLRMAVEEGWVGPWLDELLQSRAPLVA